MTLSAGALSSRDAVPDERDLVRQHGHIGDDVALTAPHRSDAQRELAVETYDVGARHAREHYGGRTHGDGRGDGVSFFHAVCKHFLAEGHDDLPRAYLSVLGEGHGGAHLALRHYLSVLRTCGRDDRLCIREQHGIHIARVFLPGDGDAHRL